MKKTRLQILALAVFLVLTGLPCQAQFTWTTNNGTITITGYAGSGGDVIIPDTISGLPVTAIGNSAFKSATSVTGVTIPDTVVSIGNWAFNACYNLTNLTIGKGLTSFGYYAFGNTALTSLIIPDTVTNIGNAAFCVCTSLTNLTIPNSVITIKPSAFTQCALTSLHIPPGVISMDGAFSVCTKLPGITVDPLNPVYTSVDGVVFDKSQTTLILCPAGRAGTYTVPNNVTTIGDGAFYYSTLTSITIPSSVTSIGQSFMVSSLASVTIQNSVTAIATRAFSQCATLTNVALGNGVTSIGDTAFYFCTSLTNLTIPSSVTNIGSGGFSGCYELTGVYFQGNAPALGSSVWGTGTYSDTNLTVYYLPGTTGWGPTSGGVPAGLWNPLPQTADGSLAVRNNQFGFNITGTANIPLVIEACTSLTTPTWVPLQNCTLTNGSIYFSDPQWSNYPARFYRIRSP